MQLDDLKEAWAAHGAALERSLAIDERLLREMLLRKARFALAPFVLFRAMEIALGVAALFGGMPVLIAHAPEPRYLVVGGALAVFAIGLTGLSIHQLTLALHLDYAGAVTAIQRQIEHLKLAEYRAFKWALLGGILLWLPAPLVLLEALSGAPFLARVESAFLVANLAVGLAFLGLGLALSRRYVEHPLLAPAARRIVDALSSRSVRVAGAHLEELARFEREDPK